MHKPTRMLAATASLLVLSLLSPAWAQPPETAPAEHDHAEHTDEATEPAPELVEADVVEAPEQAGEHAGHAQHEQPVAAPVMAQAAGGGGAAPVQVTPETAPLGSSGVGGTGGNGQPIKDPDKPR